MIVDSLILFFWDDVDCAFLLSSFTAGYILRWMMNLFTSCNPNPRLETELALLIKRR